MFTPDKHIEEKDCIFEENYWSAPQKGMKKFVGVIIWTGGSTTFVRVDAKTLRAATNKLLARFAEDEKYIDHFNIYIGGI